MNDHGKTRPSSQLPKRRQLARERRVIKNAPGSGPVSDITSSMAVTVTAGSGKTDNRTDGLATEPNVLETTTE
jgi:hypothetical protein